MSALLACRKVIYLYLYITVGRFWNSILTGGGRAAFMTIAQEMTAWATSPPTWSKSSRGQVTTHITVTSLRVCVWVRMRTFLHVCVCSAAAVGRAVLASRGIIISLFGKAAHLPSPVNHRHRPATGCRWLWTLLPPLFFLTCAPSVTIPDH